MSPIVWSVLILFSFTGRSVAQPASRAMDAMDAVIDSLAITADGQALLVKETSSDVDALANSRTAISKFNEAKQYVERFVKSDDEVMRSAVGVLVEVYEGLADQMTRAVAFRETLIRVQAELADGQTAGMNAKLAEMSIEAGTVSSAMEVIWKLVPQAAAASTYVLVDMTRTEGGKLKYLRVTATERAQLRAKLKKLFGADLDQASGRNHAVQVAPRMIWLFLEQTGWRTSDAP